MVYNLTMSFYIANLFRKNVFFLLWILELTVYISGESNATLLGYIRMRTLCVYSCSKENAYRSEFSVNSSRIFIIVCRASVYRHTYIQNTTHLIVLSDCAEKLAIFYYGDGFLFREKNLLL